MGFLNFLTSIICFFLLLFSFNLFFAKRGNTVLNYLLGVIFFSRFGQMLVLLLVNSKHQAFFPFFHQLFTPLYFAAPACFYLYVSNFINPDKKLPYKEWLHFIPVVLAIIHVIPWPFSPVINWHHILTQITDNKQLFITERSGILPAYFYFIGRPVLVLGYLTATWYRVLNSQVLKAKPKADTGKKWILLFVRAATFFQLVSFLPLLSTSQDRIYANSIFVIIGCLVLIVIVVFILHQPDIFYRYLITPIDGIKLAEKEPGRVEEAVLNTGSTKKVILLPEQSAAYAAEMEALMEAKKLYLLSDFQIIDLAAEMNISVHHCSFVVNNVIDKNFRDWINGYRINYFNTQYPLHSHKMTIEAIAHESGFKSLATFYNAFKKETGLMPKAYFSQKKVS